MSLYKAWRWVGAFDSDVMLCIARARVGPARVAWWAVWDGARLWERTRRSWRGVTVGEDGASVRDGDVRIELAWSGGEAIEVASRHGGGEIWTRKTPVRVTGEARVGGRAIAVAARGLLDESSGRHARRTRWRWSAGVGLAESGAEVTWNLVEGLHDGTSQIAAPPPAGPSAESPGAAGGRLSERAVWVEGVPHEVGALAFDGLAGVGGLAFSAVATRARRENLLVIASDYEQPFGTFTGELPVAGRLRDGWGVMERHQALW